MNNTWIKKIIPHLVAVAVFAVISIIYCRPALEGKVVNQSDMTHWKGSVQKSIEFNEVYGHYPLWTNSLFSGMPAFQIGYNSNNKIPWFAHTIFTLGLPKPAQFFFLGSIFFYFLCIVLRIKPVFGIMGALAFAYATYNPVIVSAGHETKFLSMVYMPALLASLLLIYEKKYWLGTALTALFTSILIAHNHPQIAYYFFIIAAVMTIFYVIRWVKNKDWRHFIIAGTLTAGAAIVGVLANAVSLLSVYEYQKETIRGGTALTTEENKDIKSTTGLDKSYAFSYSLRIPEPFVMLVPRIYGGSSGEEEKSQEKSKAVEALMSLPQELQRQLPLTYYWGGLIDTGLGTSGPPYVGAIIFFLALLGMFILDDKHKWWILTATGLAIIMSWGGYFETFNNLLYKHLPLYNKFRAPSMILVIPQLLLPLLAAMCVNKIAVTTDKKSLLPPFKKGLIAMAIVFVVLLLMYMMFEFVSKGDKAILKQVREMNNPELYQAVDSFYDGLKADRKSLMIGDIFRSFGFVAVAVILLFLALRNTIKSLTLGIGLTIFAFMDVMTINSKYLNSENYQDEIENESVFTKTKIDEEILRDTSFYRVFNLAGDPFSENITAYTYHAVGGYHPAKVSRYQELIENRLRPEMQKVVQSLQSNASLSAVNIPVFNMLNTKYFIQKDPRSGQTVAYMRNESALGNCWFVKGIRYVKDAREEMNALENFNPKDTAIVQESLRNLIPFEPQPDSAATIQLVKNENDIVTYTSSSTANQFAVFSEVYYPSGWKAFVDGKETPIIKVNYVLRGLALPAGKHNIVFKFEPMGYYKGRKLTSIFSIVLLLILAGGIFMQWRSDKKAASANT